MEEETPTILPRKEGVLGLCQTHFSAPLMLKQQPELLSWERRGNFYKVPILLHLDLWCCVPGTPQSPRQN